MIRATSKSNVSPSSSGRFAGSTDGLNEGNGLICEGRKRPVTTRLRDITDGIDLFTYRDLATSLGKTLG